MEDLGCLVSSGHIDTTEGQGLVSDVKVLETSEAGSDNDISLGSRLKGPSTPRVDDTIEHRTGVVAHDLERGVGAI